MVGIGYFPFLLADFAAGFLAAFLAGAFSFAAALAAAFAAAFFAGAFSALGAAFPVRAGLAATFFDALAVPASPFPLATSRSAIGSNVCPSAPASIKTTSD